MANRDTVQEIKEKLSINDVVQPYVKLARAGKHWRGLSPFNKEKTPSFFVSPERGTYHCFSSGQGGDMFTFIESMEGVDFKGALKILAEKAGVPLHYEHKSGADRSKHERTREALARAVLYFTSQLPSESDAYSYAKSRGLSEETIRSWSVGYALDGWRNLLEALSAQGFSKEELISAGLIKESSGKQGTFYDRFRNRLMFPICDIAGRTVAFTGRTLDADEQAKYLNSPETELFKKSEIIFGMDRAKDAIRVRGFALLVEGQMDVLHCHQAGFTNAIALSGTALSEHHLSIIKRYADNIMLVLDSDDAGLSATERSAKLALKAGMRVKAVMLPEGKDPADIISHDAKDFATRVTEAKSVVEFFLETLAKKEKDTHKLVQAVETKVLPLVKAVKSPLEREHFVGIVAQALATTNEAVRESLSAIPETQEISGKARIVSPKEENKPSVTTARAEILASIVTSYPESPLAKRIQNEYARIVGNTPLPEPSEKAVFETEILFGEEPSEEAVDELIGVFEQSLLKEKYEAMLDKLRCAQVAGDSKAETLAEEACADLIKCMAKSTKNLL